MQGTSSRGLTVRLMLLAVLVVGVVFLTTASTPGPKPANVTCAYDSTDYEITGVIFTGLLSCQQIFQEIRYQGLNWVQLGKTSVPPSARTQCVLTRGKEHVTVWTVAKWFPVDAPTLCVNFTQSGWK